ncbi:MAG: glycosyltransferase family 4 protein [Patescibacteria group bacterium]|jgi:glycosyltransferase involved in cell wall biosynthesis
MKIIQICQRFYYGGGQERHVFNISKNLVKLGHSVTIITSDIGELASFKKSLKLEGVKIVVLPAYPLDEPANQVVFPTLLSYLLEHDFDVLHVHGTLCQSSQVGAIAAKCKKKPYVFTPHYHPWNVFDTEKVKNIRKYFERMLTVPVIRNSSATICVSDYEKALLKRKYPEINIDRLRIIPNGIDINIVSESEPRRDVRKKFKIPENKKYVLVFGSMTDLRKGLDRSIKAFDLIAKKIPDAHLLIIGAYTDTSPELKEMISSYGLEKRVTACGYISNVREKVAFYRMSQVLISPTIYEAFGIVLAEAMYSKVPVVATKCGGVPYVLQHGEHGYLVSGYNSIHGFAKYAIRLLSDEKLRLKLGEAGHKRAVEKFQWPEISKKIEKLYKSLIAN